MKKNIIGFAHLLPSSDIVRENAQQETEALQGMVPALAAHTDQANKTTEQCQAVARLLDEVRAQLSCLNSLMSLFLLLLNFEVFVC